MTFRVQACQLPVVDCPASRVPLYSHQAAMWEGWDKYAAMLLAAKTGTGKTRAAMLPVLKRREWAMAVYPTNELLRDQVQQVARFAREEGCEALIWDPRLAGDERADRYARADHALVPVDGALLDEWQHVMRCRSRGETLRRLLNPDKPKIVFTNPDVLFLILALKYHAEPFEAMRRYQTLILDEFHVYQGVELAHALAMVALARGFGIFRRLVLLSATPPADVRALLDKALTPQVIPAGAALPRSHDGGVSCVSTQPEVKGWRTAVHEVDVTPVQVVGEDPVEILVPRLVGLRPELEHLRRETPLEDYLPAVVIVNSVLTAIRLEDRLVEAGFARDSLAVIRGLSHRAIRARQGKLLALGTSAIEVGVDFHCGHLLFEASDAASFLQRFGRVGRHRAGKAIALVPPNAFRGMSALPRDIDRAGFEERIHSWYRAADARAWFVTTEHGMVTARAMAENLVATVEKDAGASTDLIGRLRETINIVLRGHAERLGCPQQNERAKGAFERCAAGKRSSHWLMTYGQLQRFRTSLPSLSVHDFMEQGRRKEWRLGEYDIDLLTLLKRGVGLAWNDTLGMLTIRGIGKYRRVHASDIFGDEDCGSILETSDFPQMLLYQDGEYTPISDVMGKANHVFAVALKAAIQPDLDWRLPVFEAGKYVVAFDGAALLVVEMLRKARSREP